MRILSQAAIAVERTISKDGLKPYFHIFIDVVLILSTIGYIQQNDQIMAKFCEQGQSSKVRAHCKK
jgi:hypothetical protein